MSTATLETVLAAYFANFATMNPEGWVENFPEDALSYDPVGEAPAKGQTINLSDCTLN